MSKEWAKNEQRMIKEWEKIKEWAKNEYKWKKKYCKSLEKWANFVMSVMLKVI